MTDASIMPASDGSSGSARRAIDSADLFQGRKELIIIHGSEEYRLQITRAGKLILTK